MVSNLESYFKHIELEFPIRYPSKDVQQKVRHESGDQRKVRGRDIHLGIISI